MVFVPLVEVVDEPPRSDAGQDVVIQLPTDWAVLDGRDSLDDYGVSRYEWTLVQGEPSVSMKVGGGVSEWVYVCVCVCVC